MIKENNESSRELDKYFKKYRKIFHDPLPIFMVSHTDKEWIEILKNCLKKGEPYDLDKDPKFSGYNTDFDY